jgi:hypothetical protein
VDSQPGRVLGSAGREDLLTGLHGRDHWAGLGARVDGELGRRGARLAAAAEGPTPDKPAAQGTDGDPAATMTVVVAGPPSPPTTRPTDAPNALIAGAPDHPAEIGSWAGA